MGEELKVTTKELKAACDEVNALQMTDKIKTVAIYAGSMALLFSKACKVISAEDESKLSDSVVEIYNELPAESVLNKMIADRDKAKGKKPAKEKKEKVKKEPKEKKEKVKKEPKPKSRYGHIQSAKSGKLDDALFEGGTMEEIMAQVDVTRVRFIGHSNHLKNDLGLTLVITADKDKNKMKDNYKVKEKNMV